MKLYFAVTIYITATSHSKEESKGSGPESFPHTVEKNESLNIIFHGEYRSPVDNNEVKPGSTILKQFGPLNFSCTGSGTYTSRGEDFTDCWYIDENGYTAKRKEKKQYGEDTTWSYQISPDISPFSELTLEILFNPLFPLIPTPSPEHGEYHFQLFSSLNIIPIKAVGNFISWSKECGKDFSETKPINESFGDDAPILAQSALKEAFIDQNFMENWSGSFNTQQQLFSTTPHFSYCSKPVTHPLNQTYGDGDYLRRTEERKAQVEVDYALRLEDIPNQNLPHPKTGITTSVHGTTLTEMPNGKYIVVFKDGETVYFDKKACAVEKVYLVESNESAIVVLQGKAPEATIAPPPIEILGCNVYKVVCADGSTGFVEVNREGDLAVHVNSDDPAAADHILECYQGQGVGKVSQSFSLKPGTTYFAVSCADGTTGFVEEKGDGNLNVYAESDDPDAASKIRNCYYGDGEGKVTQFSCPSPESDDDNPSSPDPGPENDPDP